MNIPNEPNGVRVPKAVLAFLLGGVGTMLVSSFLALANPKPEAYAQHVVWKLKQTTCQQKNLPTLTQVSCASLSTFPHRFSEQILENYVHREDYGIFSVYLLNGFGLSDRSLGIAGRFFDANELFVDPDLKRSQVARNGVAVSETQH